MTIRITKTFEKQFQKLFQKSNFTIQDFINLIQQTKVIQLEQSFIKIKIQTQQYSLRGLWVIKSNILIPFFIVKKNNKLRWDNLVLNKATLQKINILMWKFQRDFENRNYKDYH